MNPQFDFGLDLRIRGSDRNLIRPDIKARRKPCRWAFIALRWGGVLALLASVNAHVSGELWVETSSTEKQASIVYRLTITPAAEPDPALKHRLVLRSHDLVPGNAAPEYRRAWLALASDERIIRERFGDEYDVWIRADKVRLNQLPLENVRAASLILRKSTFDPLTAATRRSQCDWGLNSASWRGVRAVQDQLDEMQNMRSLATGLSLETRLNLAQGDFDEAISHLCAMYRLSADVSREPHVICGLLGTAIAHIANREVVELIAQPDSPNLYWALTELPNPLVDMRPAMSAEMSIGLRVFPFLLEAEKANYTAEKWASLFDEALIRLDQLSSRQQVAGREKGPHVSRSTFEKMAEYEFPAAKERLIEAGYDQGRVEGMPVGQVLAIDALREYRRIADRIEKWQYVPNLHRRSRGSAALMEADLAQGAFSFGTALAAALLPSPDSYPMAQVRLNRERDALRTIEAIRMHCAVHGDFPASLGEIQVVPVPMNPATGAGFAYSREHAKVMLELPAQECGDIPRIQYELQLVEVDK